MEQWTIFWNATLVYSPIFEHFKKLFNFRNSLQHIECFASHIDIWDNEEVYSIIRKNIDLKLMFSIVYLYLDNI